MGEWPVVSATANVAGVVEAGPATPAPVEVRGSSERGDGLPPPVDGIEDRERGTSPRSIADSRPAGLRAPRPRSITDLARADRRPAAASARATAPASPDERLKARLGTLDSVLVAEKFSGTVLVAKNGQVLQAKGYGKADRAAGAANTPQTLFDVGSVTKQFVAAAILKLEERGALQVSDKISKYFDVPPPKGDITLEQLMSHTSGLDYPPDDAGPTPSPLDGKAYLEDFVNTAPLRAPPGSKYFYNNNNYGLLAYVVETASGEHLEDYLTNNLFRPAGMSSTGFAAAGSVDGRQLAKSYERSKGSRPLGPPGYDWGFRGATGVVSNVEDLYRWTEALRSDRVLSPASRERLFDTRGKPPAGSEDAYALGWHVETGADGAPAIASHGGRTKGYHSRVSVDLRDGTTIIVLGNDMSQGDLLSAPEAIVRGH